MKDSIEILDYGVSRLALVSVRNGPHADAKPITQLLFGDHYEVLKKAETGDWVYIKIHFDDSEGWIEAEQHHSISKEYFDQINHANFKITTDLTCNILFKKSPITILLGSIVPISNSELFKMEEQFAFNGEAKSLGQKRDVEFIKATAMKYLNAPHLPGGKSPFGIDAAGLVQMVFKIAGYSLSHTLLNQALEGRAVKSLGESIPGDIAFFSRKDGEISHVGIILNEEKIIHAFGRVRVDHLMEEGILRTDSKIYTHYLKDIRRIINPA
jgi:gamma-D-glutamyl-L-lysine dipeptidyl-peptidase